MAITHQRLACIVTVTAIHSTQDWTWWGFAARKTSVGLQSIVIQIFAQRDEIIVQGAHPSSLLGVEHMVE